MDNSEWKKVKKLISKPASGATRKALYYVASTTKKHKKKNTVGRDLQRDLPFHPTKKKVITRRLLERMLIGLKNQSVENCHKRTKVRRLRVHKRRAVQKQSLQGNKMDAHLRQMTGWEKQMLKKRLKKRFRIHQSCIRNIKLPVHRNTEDASNRNIKSSRHSEIANEGTFKGCRLYTN